MENKSAFDSFELQFTPVAQGFLKETAKWAYILSIFGFIGIGFMVLGALGAFASGGAAAAVDPSMPGMGMMGAIGAGVGVVYLILAALYFFPVYYLYKFASKAKNALSGNNTELLTDSLENLKSHFKFLSIFMIIVFAFSFLLILIGIVAGIGAASGM